MDHIYAGIKKLSQDVSDIRKVVNMTNGVRIVTVDGKPLTDKLSIGFDWGHGCNRQWGMNLSLSVLTSFFKEEVEVPNEFTYRLFKDVILRLDDEWEFNTFQLKEYCERVYKEIYHEEVTV